MQRAVGLPECATPPEEVYELAKRRGMDFVTITDHDTIAGVLRDRRPPRRVRLRGADGALPRRAAGRARALLRDHPRGPRVAAGAQRRRRAVRRVHAASGRSCARSRTPTTPSRRRSAPATAVAWRSCSASGRSATARAPRELNRPAATYVATRDGIGIGGSDDHAGVDIGRTYTEAPPARTPREFLAHVRSRRRARARRAGQRRQVGARGDRARGALVRAEAARTARREPSSGRTRRA